MIRRRLERRWKQGQRESDHVEYRLACHRTNKLINRSHHEYFRHQIESATDCRDRWRATKHLLHSDKSTLT